MSFFRRLLSAEYRRAVAAEAAGHLETAAEHYGVAGDREGAVRVHLMRAARAAARPQEIAALREALHWAGDDAELRVRPAALLGGALLSALEAEGIATARDRDRVREAAALLLAGGEHLRAGEALAKIGDHLGAADAFSAGGHVELMEAELAKDDDGQRRIREEQEAFASYQTNLAIGRRDEARADLQRCIGHAAAGAEVRRLLDTLEAKLITGGRVELSVRGRQPIVVCAVKRVMLGRDGLCDLSLRSGGVSRQHAEIEVHAEPLRYLLRDLGSRNGTSLGGLPVAGQLPLAGSGKFSLGDECAIDFDFVQPAAAGDGGEAAEAAGRVLRLRILSGLDRGALLLAAPEHVTIDLLGPAELGVSLAFRNGRPFLSGAGARELRFGGEPLVQGAVQLIRGDSLRIDGVDVSVV